MYPVSIYNLKTSLIISLNNQRIPWSSIVFKKLNVSHTLKKFPLFHVT